MHNTRIKLKKPNLEKMIELNGPIESIRLDMEDFGHSYIKLFGYPIVYVCEIESAITGNERISISKQGDEDEIESLKKLWEFYKSRKNCESSCCVEPENKYDLNR